jgi:hypothetical protein
MQGAGAISETILVCKPFFRTLLDEAAILGCVDLRFYESAEILRLLHARESARKDHLRDPSGNMHFGS